LSREIFRNRNLCADDKPPLPIRTPVSSRLSDKLAPTRQHQPTHAPLLSNRSEPFNPSRESPTTRKIPSLDDWKKEWGKNSQRSVQPKLLPVDFRSPSAALAQSN
jgi:hypothetical protein